MRCCCIYVILIYPILCSARHCEVIAAIDDVQAANFSDCVTANAVNIQNTKITNLTFLDNLEEIHFIPTLAPGGSAVYIVHNKLLTLDSTGAGFLPNLRKITFPGLEEKRKRAFIIQENLSCVVSKHITSLIKLGGESNIAKCDCKEAELIRGVLCYAVYDNVNINETTYVNHKFLDALKNVKEIYGYLKISNTNLRNINFLNDLWLILNPDPFHASLEITNNFLLMSAKLPFTHPNTEQGIISGYCEPYVLIENNTNLDHFFLDVFTMPFIAMKKWQKLSIDTPDYNCTSIDYNYAGAVQNSTEAEINQTDRGIDNSTELEFSSNSTETDHNSTAAEINPTDEAIKNCISCFKVKTNNCDLGKSFYLTKNSQEELRYCRTIIVEENFIINQNTIDIDPMIMRKIRRLQGCLVIENSSLTSVGFLNFETICGCNRDEIVRISNNSQLEEIGYDFIFCTNRMCPKPDSRQKNYVNITNNKQLCLKEIQAAERLSKLACNVGYTYQRNRKGICSKKIEYLVLQPLWYYLGSAFGIAIITFGIPYVFKVLLEHDFLEIEIFRNFYNFWKSDDYQEVDTIDTEEVDAAITPISTESTSTLPSKEL